MNGVFPDIWKIAKITPTFKSGAKKDVNNYRPTSVISVSQGSWRIAHDQLYEFLRANKVITTSQSAFQKLYSTVTSLISSSDSWYENIDHKQLNLMSFRSKNSIRYRRSQNHDQKTDGVWHQRDPRKLVQILSA